MEVIQKKSGNLIQVISFLLSSLALTLFLFYIDEGDYTFEGILDRQNIPALVIYASLFFAAQFFIARVVLHNYKGKYLILFAIGFFITFLLLLFLIGLLHSIVYDKI